MPGDPQIGFVGLGAMGAGMAKNLLAAGFAVTGCDRRKEAVDALVRPAARPPRTPRRPPSRPGCCSSWW